MQLSTLVSFAGRAFRTNPCARAFGALTVLRRNRAIAACRHGAPDTRLIERCRNTSKTAIWAAVAMSAFSVIGAAAAAASVPPPDGLVSWWPAEGNANDFQDGNHGMLEGATTFDDGIVGQAFRFNGVNFDGGVNLGNVAAFDFSQTSSFTLEAWVNSFGPTAPPHDGQIIIALNYHCSNTFQGLSIANATGTLSFGVRDANGLGTFVTSPPLSTNTFHHVAGVREVSPSGKTLKLYVDGVLVGMAVDPSTGVLAADTPDYIGRRFPCAVTNTFNGLIDEARVYNRVLSAAEVQSIYAPIADAGPDQTVDEGAGVSLDGTASTGSGLSYVWTQLAGPEATLSGANTASPSFIAPLRPGGFGSQTMTFQLTVSSGSQSVSDTVDVTVRNVNHTPVADAGIDQVVEEGSAVGLSATPSYDPDNDPLTYQWVQTGGSAVALTGATTATPTFTAPLLAGGIGGAVTLTFEVTVSDGALSHSDTVAVTVEQVNHAPVADAGPPQTVHSGTPVTLDASGSTDPDGDALGFIWIQVGGPPVTLANANTSAPTFTAPPIGGSATLTFRLTAGDGLLSSADDVDVTVTNGIPRCDLALASPGLLWPPNHTLRAVSIINVTDPNDEAVTLTVTGVAQDEPVNGLGDGDTSPDAILQGHAVLLRAERAGGGNGRVYTIAFSADDGLGGVCSGSVKVTVPHDMKRRSAVVDDGPLYDSTVP